MITLEESVGKKIKKPKKERIKKERKFNYEKVINSFLRLKPKYMNLPILCTVLGLAIFGLMMVYSASNYNAQVYYDNKYYYLSSQLIGFILGVVALTFMYFIDYKIFAKFKWIFFGAGMVLLLLVFIPGLGIERLGSKRWIGIGGFSMQPSEIAKFSFCIFCAAVAAGNTAQQDILSFKKVLLILAAGGSYCALILSEPNLSITLCLGITMFVMLFLCGARKKHLALLMAPLLVLVPVLMIAEPYRVRRLVAFANPWASPKDEGFQLIQSLFGLGNGGLFGVGYGNSTQKYMFLPFSESDFIFSIVGEEFGFIGCLLFMIALGFLIYKIFKVGIACKDNFGKYLCFGIGVVIFVQSFINLAVVTGSIPPTGVPLPFISFGGTSLAVFLGAIGIVLNVHKQNKSTFGVS